MQSTHRTSVYVSEEARWQAILARDPAADGPFVYAVRTTGVYCRPSSSARRPKRQNVEFFDSAQAADAAGSRASRTAKGDQPSVTAERAQPAQPSSRPSDESENHPT